MEVNLFFFCANHEISVFPQGTLTSCVHNSLQYMYLNLVTPSLIYYPDFAALQFLERLLADHPLCTIHPSISTCQKWTAYISLESYSLSYFFHGYQHTQVPSTDCQVSLSHNFLQTHLCLAPGACPVCCLYLIWNTISLLHPRMLLIYFLE